MSGPFETANQARWVEDYEDRHSLNRRDMIAFGIPRGDDPYMTVVYLWIKTGSRASSEQFEHLVVVEPDGVGRTVSAVPIHGAEMARIYQSAVLETARSLP